MRSSDLKNNQVIKHFAIVLILGVTFTLAITILSRESLLDMLKFIVFQFFILWLPGIAIVLLFDFHIKKTIAFLPVSYCLGYMFNILIYFFIVPFGRQKYILVFNFFITILSALVIFFRRTKLKSFQDEKCDFLKCCVLFTGMYILFLFTFSLNNLIPGEAIQANTFFNDNFHWMGNSIELAKEFPPQDFRAIQNPLHYHYFSSIPVALMNLATEIPVATLSFYYLPIQSAFMLSFMTYCIADKFIKNKKLVFLGIIVLYFTAGFEIYSYQTFMSHIYVASFGFDIAIVLSLLAIYFAKLQDESQSFSIPIAVGELLAFICCLCSKGPVGALTLICLGIVCLKWLFKDKRVLVAFAYGFTLLLSFGIFYFTILTGENAQTLSIEVAQNSSAISILDMEYVGKLFDRFIATGMPSFLYQPLFLIAFCILSHPIIFLTFSVGIIIKSIRKKWDIFDFGFLMMSFAGMFLVRLLKHFGLSQMYFFIGIFPIALILGLRGIDILLGTAKQNTKKWKVLFYPSMCLFLVLLIQCIYNLNEATTVGENFVAGFKKKFMPYSIEIDEDHNYTTADDMEAYEWIRINTNTNDLIMSDRGCIDTYNRVPYGIGVLTERYIYMTENPELLKRCMENDKSAIPELRRSGVQYIIQTKRLHPDFQPDKKDVTQVYNGKSIVVYRINNQM